VFWLKEQSLSSAGLHSPKKRRRIKAHRRRKRKAQAGLRLQMDAIPFEWFSGSDKFSLHGAIADATVVQLSSQKQKRNSHR
jgi:hypothetical protein